MHIGLPFVNNGKVINMAKKRSDRERSPFGRRMVVARERAGMTQMAVREALGISQGTLSELERTSASSGKVVEFARLYNVDAAWLATGEGIAPSGTTLSNRSAEAHAQSQSGVTFPLQRTQEFVAWGELGMRELEGTFCVNAPDDAMAPVIKRGARIEFDRSLEPRTDDVVLLKDGAGVWYIRTYQQGPRKRWGAKPENGTFLPMDSERDELEVIAVLTAVHGRRG